MGAVSGLLDKQGRFNASKAGGEAHVPVPRPPRERNGGTRSRPGGTLWERDHTRGAFQGASSLRQTYAFKNGDDEWQTRVLEAGETKPWLPFAEARAFVWTLKLESHADWQEYSKSGNRPINIPSSPDKVYGGDKGWVSFPEWMGYVYL